MTICPPNEHFALSLTPQQVGRAINSFLESENLFHQQRNDMKINVFSRYHNHLLQENSFDLLITRGVLQHCVITFDFNSKKKSLNIGRAFMYTGHGWQEDFMKAPYNKELIFFEDKTPNFDQLLLKEINQEKMLALCEDRKKLKNILYQHGNQTYITETSGNNWTGAMSSTVPFKFESILPFLNSINTKNVDKVSQYKIDDVIFITSLNKDELAMINNIHAIKKEEAQLLEMMHDKQIISILKEEYAAPKKQTLLDKIKNNWKFK